MLHIFIAICVGLLGSVSAFPNGAPEIACGEMVPGHLPSSASGTNPFTLNISATTYKPGDEITGSLYSTDNQNFRGFLIRVGAQNTVPSEEMGVGDFIDLDDSIQKNVCGTSGVTHIDNKDKTRVTFKWKAPATASGDLYVRATVVQKFFPSKYWLDTFSKVITAA